VNVHAIDGTTVAHAMRMNPSPASDVSLAAPALLPGWTPDEGAATRRRPRIVAIGGGTGLPAVLEGLCAHAQAVGGLENDSVTAVVTITDEGGSSGRLRREFGVLPPGDIRNCLAALATTDSPFKQLLQHRFESDSALAGHALGNLLLTALTQITGDFSEAVQRLSEMMGVRGRVLPTTCVNVRLRAAMASGQIVTGETNITAKRMKIRRLTLEPSPRPLPEVLRALVNADGIVVGPGSLYTSLLPNLLVEGIASTIYGVDAVRIYVANLMTEPGETDHYTLDDHLRAIRVHVGFDLFDYILVSRRPAETEEWTQYAQPGSELITTPATLEWAGRAQLVECNLPVEYRHGKIRHESLPVARAIRALVHAGRP
jgi:uncharacterized cofD-like protein